jgi:hypothetical protein
VKPRIPIRRRGRVRRILATLAALQQYDDERRAAGETVVEGEVDHLLHHRLFQHTTFDDWDAKRMRAFVTMACLFAPDVVLDKWAALADEELAEHRDGWAVTEREAARDAFVFDEQAANAAATAKAAKRAEQEREVAAQLKELSQTNPVKFDEMMVLLAKLVAEAEAEQAGAV